MKARIERHIVALVIRLNRWLAWALSPGVERRDLDGTC
jgi:hypothetical protein